MWFPWAALLVSASLLAPPWARVVKLRTPKSERVRVPEGSFAMGSTAEEMVEGLNLCRREVWGSRCDGMYGNPIRLEGHAHTVSLRAFELDRTEVTVGAYKRCTEAGHCSPAAIPNDPHFNSPSLPIVMVRKVDAETYCGFVGGRLPTEAEWEYAARGPTRRRFPWGNLYNGRLCNHGSLSSDSADASDGFEGLAPVGSFPDGAGPFGTLDQAGNVAEWVADGFERETRDGFGYEPSVVQNPQSVGPRSIIRGGSYQDGALLMRSAYRGIYEAARFVRSPSVGFRCAYDLQ